MSAWYVIPDSPTTVVTGGDAALDCTGSGRDHEQDCANSRLIASAPELLEVLRSCHYYLSCIPESAAGGDDDAVLLTRRAAAVIAKAEGQA